MPGLCSWIRRKRRRFQKSHLAPFDGPWEPQCLREPRPKYLTRPSSPIYPSSTLISTSSSLFFNTLPLEIRRAIYVHAFGNRTVHMDLQYKIADNDGVGHAKIDYRLTELEEEMPVFKSGGPLAWRWWSCVCHRTPGWPEPLDYDRCRVGRGICHNNGPLHEDCFIGVMGWLLTCRQAYVEAIDLLYSSNTIFIESVFLMTNIHRFIIPQRLASITSLELYWGPQSTFLSPSMYTGTSRTFAEVTSLIRPERFKNLQKLEVSFTNLYHGYMDELGILSGTPMEYPVQYFVPYSDFLVREYAGQLKKYTIAFPRTFYDDVRKRLLTEEAEEATSKDYDMPEGLPYKYFWRSIPVAVDSAENKPGKGLGYWIREGMDDSPLRYQTLH